MRVFICGMLFIMAAGCGKPLMDGEYRGVPLYSFQGEVVSYVAGTGANDNLRVALFWSPSGETRVPVAELHEQASSSVSVRFPSTFEINVFSRPVPNALVEVSPSYGLALILIYRDENGNRRFDSGSEVLAGGATHRVLLYAPEALAAEHSPTGLPVPRGFTTAEIPFPCGFETELTHGTESCDPRLGGPCQVDSDCGQGALCLGDLGGYSFPSGMCTWEVSEYTCSPMDGTSIALGRSNWLLKCVDDLDCPRAGYTCQNVDAWLGSDCWACWPEGKTLDHYVYCTTHQEWQGDRDCGDHLGGPCQQDQDCADTLDSGRCLATFGNVVLPNGYCTLEEPTFGCLPPRGLGTVLYTYHWFPSCGSDIECRPGYRCDTIYLSCLPDLPMQLTILPGFTTQQRIEPLCMD